MRAVIMMGVNTGRAELVLGSLRGSMDEADKMHANLQQLAIDQQQCRDATREFSSQCTQEVSGLQRLMETFGDSMSGSREEMRRAVVSIEQDVLGTSGKVDENLNGLVSKLVHDLQSLKEQDSAVRLYGLDCEW